MRIPKEYVRYCHVGLQFFITIGLLTYLGYWLDTKFGTVPLFILIGTGLGFAAGFYGLVKQVYGWEKKGEA